MEYTIMDISWGQSGKGKMLTTDILNVFNNAYWEVKFGIMSLIMW